MATRRETIAQLLAAGTVSELGPARAASGAKPISAVRRIIGPIVQHGYVVMDAAKEAMRWGEQLGVGPFYISESEVDNYVFRGRPAKITLRIAFSYWDDDQIELIQQISTEESLYSDSIRTAPGKLNHVAVKVADIDAAIRNLGAGKRLGHRGGDGNLEFAYLESYMPDGSHLELMRVSPAIEAMFEGVKAICRVWDGTRPVRTAQDLLADLAAIKKTASTPRSPTRRG